MTTEKARSILASALDGTNVMAGRPSGGPDLVIQTRDGRQIAIEFKWAGEGWPEDVRRAAGDVHDPWPDNVIVLARHLSPGAIEWLRARNANWADDAGQARILGPEGLLVIREPRRRDDDRRDERAFSWSPSAISIAEAILARPDEALHAATVAAASGWSAPQTATVLKSFDAQGWTAKRGSARGPRAYRELIDADAMIAAWSAAIGSEHRRTRNAHRVTSDVMSLLDDELAPALNRSLTWALSGWAALELAAPFATTTPSLHIYVADDDFAGPLSSAIEDAGLHEVGEGGRVRFWRADRRLFSLASERRGVPIASAPRLYADLSSFGGRGQDAADHLKNALIDPLHAASMSAAAREVPPERE